MLAVGILTTELCVILAGILTVNKHSGDPGLAACMYLQRSQHVFAGEQNKSSGLKLHFHHDFQHNLSASQEAEHCTSHLPCYEMG